MPSNFLSLLPCVRKEEAQDQKRKRSFLMMNGSMVLEDLIASYDGKSNPIRCYSADELIRATNNFHPSCILREDSYFKSFRGFLGDRAIIINKFTGHGNEDKARSQAIRDIVISIQMSNHKNVLKLLGCCLEFTAPALVFEYATKGALNNRGRLGDNNEPLPWKTRLRIAKQVANAITYLHTAFPRPIIYRNVTHACIVLDDDYVPKLCDFSFSVTIPPEQSHVLEDFDRGISAYMDPTFIKTCISTEKSDVHGLGVLLLVFLTGRQAYDWDPAAEYKLIGPCVKLHACDGQIQTIVDPKILEGVGGDVQAQQQLRDFLALALLCIQDESKLRPCMIDVAKELVRIEKSTLQVQQH